MTPTPPSADELEEARKMLAADWVTIENPDGTFSIDYIGFTNAVALHIDAITFALSFAKEAIGPVGKDVWQEGFAEYILSDKDAVNKVFKSMVAAIVEKVRKDGVE